MSKPACPEWLETAVCRCGCQRGSLRRKYLPDSDAWFMNWGSPKWLSQETQALLDGFLPDDYDPACKLPKPRLADEYWIGDRQVSAEEFERSCVEDAEREKRDLDRHVRESAENLMAYLNEKGGLRTIHDISNTEVGALAACVLMLDKERSATETRR